MFISKLVSKNKGFSCYCIFKCDKKDIEIIKVKNNHLNLQIRFSKGYLKFQSESNYFTMHINLIIFYTFTVNQCLKLSMLKIILET